MWRIRFGVPVLVIGLPVAATAAEWVVEDHVDATTNEIKKTAIVENESAYSFSVYRVSPGASVWGRFALSGNMIDQVDWEKPPIYRIDNHEPTPLEGVRKLEEVGIPAYSWQPNSVAFRIWHGNESQGVSEDIVHLMEGDEVVFRYFLRTGGFEETAFSLNGANSAIPKAIDIKP
jgi:hypothetical protein